MADIVPMERISSKIYVIRDTRVMLDRDHAELYGVETRVLNQAVQRNIKRFPADFMLTLGREEIMRISQIVTSSQIKYSKRVHAFTEHGVAHLGNFESLDKRLKKRLSDFAGTRRSEMGGRA